MSEYAELAELDEFGDEPIRLAQVLVDTSHGEVTLRNDGFYYWLSIDGLSVTDWINTVDERSPRSVAYVARDLVWEVLEQNEKYMSKAEEDARFSRGYMLRCLFQPSLIYDLLKIKKGTTIARGLLEKLHSIIEFDY